MKHFVVVGLGSIGRRHAGNLARLDPEARFTFVRRDAATDEFSTRLGASVVDDVDDVEGDVDLAVVSTPSAQHADVLPDLIDRGWPLIVEKPVVTEVADCDALDEHLRDAPDAVRVVGFNLRYLPSLRTARDLLHSGELGTVVRASLTAGQWLPDWRPGTDYRTGYSADRMRGGGVELDLAHEFDVARWFFGDVRVDHAVCGRFSELEIESNDTAVAVVSPESSAAPVVTVQLDYVSRRRVRRYEIVGDRGTLVWDLDGTLAVESASGRRIFADEMSAFDVDQTYRTMIESTETAIATGDLSHVQSISDGLSSTRLVLDVRDRGRTR